MMPAANSGAVAPPSNTLGNTAKSIHAGREAAQLSGIFERAKTRQYALQRAAAGLLWDSAGGKRQKFRVAHCGRSIQGQGVAVFRAANGTRARFGGLTTCGSGWTCPVCAGKIAEVRREELQKAMVQHVTAGGRVHLATLTFPHEADWPLADLLEKFDKARQRFKNSRTWKRILGTAKKPGDAGMVGAVSSLEVTHGANGWHPHLHMLLFVARSIGEEEAAELTKAWVNCLFKAGLGDHAKLSDMMAHALDLRGGEDAAAYIVKYGREEADWGLSSELTRTHAKQANHGGLTPFGLLTQYVEGEGWAGARFVEFANAFLGKRLLTWSPGLKKKFNLEEVEDEAAAERPDDAEEYVGWINPDQWKIVLRADARAELLGYAASACIDPDRKQSDLDEFIQYLATRPPKSKAWFIQPMQRRPFQ